MTRSIAQWIGIAAVCLAILLIPIWNGATKAAEDTRSSWLTFDVPALVSQEKDCIGSFDSDREAQRFFLKHGGPKRDPHGLDGDGDGRACEELDSADGLDRGADVRPEVPHRR
jgi:hypothetical protein